MDNFGMLAWPIEHTCCTIFLCEHLMTIILHFSCTAMCHWSIVACLANRTYTLHHIFSVIWNDRDHGWLELLKQKGFCQCYQQRSSDWVLLMLSPWIQTLPFSNLWLVTAFVILAMSCTVPVPKFWRWQNSYQKKWKRRTLFGVNQY